MSPTTIQLMMPTFSTLLTSRDAASTSIDFAGASPDTRDEGAKCREHHSSTHFGENEGIIAAPLYGLETGARMVSCGSL
jgi:hypothetical protein